ncbi:hypothetical protein PDO_4899 [Rhizobium sp. PDO1-076]|nr:hypothetical protein PDO_4899 [Rhizobium sp. PDO1-076]
MAYIGNLNRHTAVSRRSVIRGSDINVWAGRVAAGASFLFIAVVIFGL